MHGMASTTAAKSLLRFFIGGSVDDGKSTLLGRLIYDAGAVTEDQLTTLQQDSMRFGTTGDALDLALLVDGLEDERKQGITIDVAHRYFATARRAFIVADTPGHESYTRNTATGASNADLAVIVVDARRGVLPQTRRHTAIAHLVGVRRFILAVNKCDAVNWEPAVFERIVSAFRDFARSLGLANIEAVPLSALHGDNVAIRSRHAAWYDGPSLLELLESTPAAAVSASAPLRLPVQLVLRPDSDTRLYAGTVASGEVACGDAVRVAISGACSVVSQIFVAGAERERANQGDAVAIALADHIDVGRGDILVPPDRSPQVAGQFEAHLIWMGDLPLLPGRGYLLKIGTRTVQASITAVKHQLDIDTMHREAAHTLRLNEIGLCDIAVASPVAIDNFTDVPPTGRFILTDRYSNATIAAGTIDFALRRGMNIKIQRLAVNKQTRSALKDQKPCVIWFTGLSGSGKSTIANLVEARLVARERHTYLLDGDNVRHGLNKGLGFTDADRVENIRRVGEAAKLFVDAGTIVLCSFISPFRAERAAIRDLLEPGEFIEVFLSTPLEVCEARDPKGLYAKARTGELPHFTGIDSPYEPPENPDLVLDTTAASADELAERVVNLLVQRGKIGASVP